jgi:dTDP-4-amino-4,6-dideoxy-D-galactose acyltransferase
MNKKKAYQLLVWDTRFFGVTVAKILSLSLKQEEIREILVDMGRNGVKLAYWQSNKKIVDNKAKTLGAQFVNRRALFEVDFQSLNPGKFISTDTVERYTSSMSVVELEALAIQSGEYSRFSVDPNVPRDKFENLYKIWIRNSLNKESANEVLVIREGKSIVGMVTLGERNGKGDIGLIAVDSNYRGRKFGEKLVRAAQDWFIRNNYRSGQVITQIENIPACNLYKKCGYSITEVVYCYHFWL